MEHKEIIVFAIGFSLAMSIVGFLLGHFIAGIMNLMLCGINIWVYINRS